ncbi:hypothetical protein MJG53_016760 [Ovis ammon polii x Ovis aries]|uniref:Uncharacterized protein n=1 Tax=Ovis ammon polii x Ovis aries TaxID=2918886 RepID=A0ACB9UA43_9CETA|nr:hypothetical protein MJG53_016760 [Ovis ammon polii x Ovis aries]
MQPLMDKAGDGKEMGNGSWCHSAFQLTHPLILISVRRGFPGTLGRNFSCNPYVCLERGAGFGMSVERRGGIPYPRKTLSPGSSCMSGGTENTSCLQSLLCSTLNGPSTAANRPEEFPRIFQLQFLGSKKTGPSVEDLHLGGQVKLLARTALPCLLPCSASLPLSAVGSGPLVDFHMSLAPGPFAAAPEAAPHPRSAAPALTTRPGSELEWAQQLHRWLPS